MWRAVTLAWWACWLGLPAWTQVEEPGFVFRSDARLVVLHATVVGPGGDLVTDLPQSAFHIFEDGVEQHIKVFRREDAPVSLGLVIDASGSMLGKREKVKAAALALVRASHPQDEVFIINFNERSWLDTEFTNQIARLEEGLGRAEPQGITAMRDAVRLALEHLWVRGERDKKVILVVTDGEDNASSIELKYLVRAAPQTGILVYALGLLGEASREATARARSDLDALTHATGGQSWYLDDVAQAERVALEVARDIRNQYTLAYTPSNQALDGGYRRIRVTAQGSQPLTVRTRTGYYAGPAPSSASRP
ncbi:MAG: VWA domain-containing protein [Acidobacteria bacterium]|nr:VWA domain-containing protein [Acidobacteriota bacterium]